MTEIHLHKIFQGMVRELQYIIIGLFLMGIGWSNLINSTFLSFLVFVIGDILAIIGIGKSIEFAQS